MLVHSDAELYALLIGAFAITPFLPLEVYADTHTDTVYQAFQGLPYLPLLSRVLPIFLPSGVRHTPTVFLPWFLSVPRFLIYCCKGIKKAYEVSKHPIGY